MELDTYSPAPTYLVDEQTSLGGAETFEKILSEGYKPNIVQSDKGTEFLNSTFQSRLKRYDIHFCTSENEGLKAAVVERFNRTPKEKMFRYFTHANTRRYSDTLDDLIHSYKNTTIDRSEWRRWKSTKTTKTSFELVYIR